MNYIELVNFFWEVYESEESELGPSDAVLFFHLLNVCNKCNWKNPFKRRNTIITATLKMSKSTFIRSREALQKEGLITFKSNGHGDNNIEYEISPPLKKYQKKSKNETSFDTLNEPSNETSFDTHKLNSKLKTVNVKKVVSEEERAALFEKYCEEENKKLEDHLAGRDDFEEKEKSFAQKEKEWPLWSDMLPTVKMCSFYDNAKRLLPDPMNDIRESEFEWFWEQKRDEYLARKTMPAFTEISSHFYYWLDKKITSNRNKTFTPTKNGAHKTGSTNRLAIATNWDAKP